MTFYNNLQFRVIARRFIMFSKNGPFEAETNSIEYIRNGHLILLANGRKIDLKAPVMFWMKTGGHYRFLMTEKQSQPIEHLYFDFYGERSEQILTELERICPEGSLVPHDPEKVSELFFDMLKYYRQAPVYYHPELSVEVEKLMLMIVQSLRPSNHSVQDTYGIWSMAEDIRRDPFRKFDFHSQSLSVGISYDHYRKLFKEMHKMPPQVYVRNQQMSLVAEMLRTTNMRIKEIMYNCQFESLMDFSRSFKKYAGMSPKDYRKNYERHKFK